MKQYSSMTRFRRGSILLAIFYCMLTSTLYLYDLSLMYDIRTVWLIRLSRTKHIPSTNNLLSLTVHFKSFIAVHFGLQFILIERRQQRLACPEPGSSAPSQQLPRLRRRERRSSHRMSKLWRLYVLLSSNIRSKRKSLRSKVRLKAIASMLTKRNMPPRRS